MDFVTKSFRNDETLTSWPLLQHICPHFWPWLLNTIAITAKSEDKYVVKVVNWSEFHLSQMTLLQNPYFNNFECKWQMQTKSGQIVLYLEIFNFKTFRAEILQTFELIIWKINDFINPLFTTALCPSFFFETDVTNQNFRKINIPDKISSNRTIVICTIQSSQNI